MTKAVLIGLLVDTDAQKKELKEGFEGLGFVAPKIIHIFRTRAGKGGPGGRSDVLVEFDDKDIPRLAVHPLHLTGMFSWHDDYFTNNRSIIPESALPFFKD